MNGERFTANAARVLHENILEKERPNHLSKVMDKVREAIMLGDGTRSVVFQTNDAEYFEEELSKRGFTVTVRKDDRWIASLVEVEL